MEKEYCKGCGYLWDAGDGLYCEFWGAVPAEVEACDMHTEKQDDKEEGDDDEECR